MAASNKLCLAQTLAERPKAFHGLRAPLLPQVVADLAAHLHITHPLEAVAAREAAWPPRDSRKKGVIREAWFHFWLPVLRMKTTELSSRWMKSLN